jgi:hypothetical protein
VGFLATQGGRLRFWMAGRGASGRHALQLQIRCGCIRLGGASVAVIRRRCGPTARRGGQRFGECCGATAVPLPELSTSRLGGGCGGPAAAAGGRAGGGVGSGGGGGGAMCSGRRWPGEWAAWGLGRRVHAGGRRAHYGRACAWWATAPCPRCAPAWAASRFQVLKQVLLPFLKGHAAACALTVQSRCIGTDCQLKSPGAKSVTDLLFS